LPLALASEFDAEHVPAAPGNFAPARGTPGHKRDAELASDFDHGVQAYLRTVLRNVCDLAFVDSRPAIERDPGRLMPASAKLLALHF